MSQDVVEQVIKQLAPRQRRTDNSVTTIERIVEEIGVLRIIDRMLPVLGLDRSSLVAYAVLVLADSLVREGLMELPEDLREYMKQKLEFLRKRLKAGEKIS